MTADPNETLMPMHKLVIWGWGQITRINENYYEIEGGVVLVLVSAC